MIKMFEWIKNLFKKKREGGKVYNILTPEFHEKAKEITGIEWDFSRLEAHRCCVRDCFRHRLWGFWTCEKHKLIETTCFNPVDENGFTFWSHKLDKRMSNDEFKKNWFWWFGK